MNLVLLYIASYFLGSVPFGLLVGKLKGVDIRKVGSGNIGATNAYRALGWGGGIAVFILDVGKGMVPPLLAKELLPGTMPPGEVINHAVLMGAAAVIGHSFSPFLGFKGGKGVATGLGVLLGVAPVVGIAGVSASFFIIATTRYVSIASIVACIVVMVGALITHQPPIVLGAFGFVTAFVLIRHIPNIKRLIKGEESRLEFKRKPKESDEPAEEGPAKKNDEPTEVGQASE